MVSATGSVLSAPVITIYVRHHKDCPHSDHHFYKGKGCNCPGYPHMLRDTFAVRLWERGVPMEEVSKARGHGSIKTTEKFYNPWIKTRQERLDGLVMGAWD
jgi:integrase